jgi:hypothetical protein
MEWNMRKFLSIGFLATLFLGLNACGGGDEAFQNPDNPDTPTGPVAASMVLVTSTPRISSSSTTQSAEITAFIRDANNNFIQDVDVTFSADSGGLTVTQGTTDVDGKATATLNAAGDPTNRDITVTATSGTISQTVTVAVFGTDLTVQGPNSLTIGQTATYTVTLADEDGNGIEGKTVTLESSNSNTVDPASGTSGENGEVDFTVTVANTGSDTLTASALGTTAVKTISVNDDAFTFISPAADSEIEITGPAQQVQVRWQTGGANVADGSQVTFSSTRGSFGGQPTVTVGTVNGVATTTINATNAGFGDITATTSGGQSTSLHVEFVATEPDSIEVQAAEFAVAPQGTTTITATVRDGAGNRVKNKTIAFTLTDVSGGTLSTGSVVTNSDGEAKTIFRAGNGTSARDGVSIVGTVVEDPSITDEVLLTVAQRELFIKLGTGNTIQEPNEAQYKVQYVVQVTDSNGAGVAGVPVTLSMLSQRYLKGYRVAGANTWGTCYTTVTPGQTASTKDPSSGAVTFCNSDEGTGKAGSAGCTDEDTNRNGILDTVPFEDANGSGQLEAGNIATVSPGSITTDANGFALVDVFYPQQYAYYLWVAIEGRTSVQGTEFANSLTFLLEGSAEDFSDLTKGPPGPKSPFGECTICTDIL